MDAVKNYIARYRHKASVLAIIHSNLAKNSNRWDIGHTCAIVVFTALFTFLGLMGSDRILSALQLNQATTETNATHRAADPVAAPDNKSSPKPPEKGTFLSKDTFEFIFNTIVILLFVASLLNLIFRWKDRYTAHFSGVVRLRQFIGWLDELALLDASSIDPGKLKHIRHKYESIIEQLPPNSDKDYDKAKKSMNAKPSEVSRTVSVKANQIFDDEKLIKKIVLSSPVTMEVLKVVSRYSEELWLGGGSVRTLAWNYLTGRSEKVHDYDVVYFDQKNLDEAAEKKIEAELKEKLPRTIKISVKNQARMHKVNGEPERHSLNDAISNWPETATATAMRIDKNGKIITIDPYGFSDVLDLIVQPTPSHIKNPKAYLRRLAEKQWDAHWPELEICRPTMPIGDIL